MCIPVFGHLMQQRLKEAVKYCPQNSNFLDFGIKNKPKEAIAEKGRKGASFLFQSLNLFFFLFLVQALTSQYNTISSLWMQALSCLVMKYMPRVQGILETETHMRVFHLCSLINNYHWTNSPQSENSESLQNTHPIPLKWRRDPEMANPPEMKYNLILSSNNI